MSVVGSRRVRVSPASALRPPAAPVCARVIRSAAWRPPGPAAAHWLRGRRPGTAPRPPAPGETKAGSVCGTDRGTGGAEAQGGTGPNPHLGLGLLSRAPPPLLLLVGSRLGLGGRVFGGRLGAHPQVLAALHILELGPPQCLHRLVLWAEEGRGHCFFICFPSPLPQPPTLDLTIRFCSFIHCSLNSFRHFSISVRLAARGWEGWGMGMLPQGYSIIAFTGATCLSSFGPFSGSALSLLGLLTQKTSALP